MSTKELTERVISQLILEYRPSIETIGKIFQMDETEINERLLNTPNYGLKNALIYVLYYETKEDGLIDQNEAKKNIQRFITKLHLAKDNKAKLNVIKELDSTANIERLQKKKYEDYSKDDIINLIKYRYKYALTRAVITENYAITTDALRYQESILDEGFKKKLKVLNDYNNIKYFQK